MGKYFEQQVPIVLSKLAESNPRLNQVRRNFFYFFVFLFFLFIEFPISSFCFVKPTINHNIFSMSFHYLISIVFTTGFPLIQRSLQN